MGKYKDIWNREKDGSHKSERSFVRYAIVVTALTVIFLFVKKDSVIRWIQAGFTLRRQERQVEWYMRENAALDAGIREMSADKDTLEAYARENFGFAEPGDDVYLVE